MSMTPEQIRLKQSPVLTSMLLGMGQGTMVAEKLFPRLPQALASVMIGRRGDEARRRYNLQRAPGAATKRINIKYDGKVYTVKQKSVEVPIPRELVREADEAAKLNIGANLEISEVAMTTASDVLALDYELDTAELATDPAAYLTGHVESPTGTSKWSDPASTPIQDVNDAVNVVRKAVGRRANTLILSADVFQALQNNPSIIDRLPSNITGTVNLDHIKTLFGIPNIFVADAAWTKEDNSNEDVWGNNAILAYVPTIGGTSGRGMSLAEPAFGITNVIEGHPFAEPAYFEEQTKSWVYGATFERQPNIIDAGAGFLFANPA